MQSSMSLQDPCAKDSFLTLLLVSGPSSYFMEQLGWSGTGPPILWTMPLVPFLSSGIWIVPLRWLSKLTFDTWAFSDSVYTHFHTCDSVIFWKELYRVLPEAEKIHRHFLNCSARVGDTDMILNSWFLSFRKGFSFNVNMCCGESKKEPKDECHEWESCFRNTWHLSADNNYDY